MSMCPRSINQVPHTTSQVAKAAFAKGNLYLTMRDEIGTFYTDRDFEELFSEEGHPAESPWRLALICVMQYIEGLSDRQAAEAVRSRIDWKYALGLELTDSGFDFSVLSEFRKRLITGGVEQQLLDLLLAQFKERGWLKERGKQRTDSTHVLAAIRTLNRLEGNGETLRAALNAIATVAPDWLRSWVPPEWFERYSRAFDEYHLPKGISARTKYAEIIGNDGMQLLKVLWETSTVAYLRQIPAVEILRLTWIHQYYVENNSLRLRAATELPPTGTRMDSPYDKDARYGNKRSVTWTGYKVHITETCDADEVHLITNVDTTQAQISDVDRTEPIHKSLVSKKLLPKVHIVDAGYVDANLLVTSQKQYGVIVVGPARPNVSWQSKMPGGYDISQFKVNWNTKRVTCPMGKKSTQKWTPYQDKWGNQVIRVSFPRKTCQLCPSRSLCTRSASEPRKLTLRLKKEHELLQSLRIQQETSSWKETYDTRAGVEGTISQGVRAFGLRKARYIGLAKVHLQHILTAAAINVVRMVAWLDGIPHATTRTSRFAALAPN
jgi:transposase